MSLKSVVRELLPPIVTKTLRPPTKYGPWGHYPSWEAAARAAGPYKSYFPIIDEHRTATARGEYEPPCFTGFLFAAIHASPAPVHVLDFGGGVGLGYERAAHTIAGKIASWRIVDLPDVIEHGNKLPKNVVRTFHPSIAEAVKDRPPIDIVTCSSVLQCMEDSYGALTELFSLGARYIHLDRLPLEREERFSVFHTVNGDQIAWRILSRDRLQTIAREYRLIYESKLPKHPTAEAASEEYTLLYHR